MPYCGRAVSLAEYQVAPLDDLAPEQFSHLLHPDQLADELAQASARRIRLKPVLNFSTLLLHGLRAIRYHYATRMSFFISCVKLHMHQPEAVPHPLVPAARSPSDRFSAWCSTPAGQGVLQQLRWLAPTQQILVARLQAELGTVPASSQALWVSLSQSRGVPIRTGTSLSWGFHLSWDDAKSLLRTRCTCDLLPGPIPALCLCPTCGEAQTQSASTETFLVFGAVLLVLVFAPTPDHTICLCPDCAHSWMHLAASSPIRVLRPAVPRELWLHVSSLANRAQVGAGHNVAQQTGLSCRRIKRWLLRYLQRHSGPIPVSTIRIDCLSAFAGAPDLNPIFTTVISNMRREGALLCATAHASHEPTIELAHDL